MCGISGILDTSGSRAPDELESIAVRMADALAHRGPDDHGAWAASDGRIALGHRRLAIIDLSSAGRQPMESADGRWVLTYNGELYNTDELRARLGSDRAFRGHSDTEVLVEAIAAWGVESTLHRSVGMFAFAVWDRRDRQLWLARDRFGEKPLYYTHQGRSVTFASELKGLLAVPDFRPSIDRDALVLFLERSVIPCPHTIYEGVAKLDPGSHIRFAHDGSTQGPVRYWTPVDEAAGAGVQPQRGQDAIDELDELLSRVVATRMVSDVPLGAFLSGGVDSSTVVAMMLRAGAPDVRTFTIGFEDPRFDESGAAADVARALGTDHRELTVTGSDALSVIPLLPRIYDEPFADSSQIPTYLVSRFTRDHVTVALSGDGGDELFGGYDRYSHFERLDRLRKVPLVVRRAAGGAIGRVSPERWDALSRGPLGRLLPAPMRNRTGTRAHKLARMLRAADAPELYRLLLSVADDARALVHGIDPPPPTSSPHGRLGDRSPIEQAMLSDTVSYLPDDILTKVDRASMAVSLEVRVPLLDTDIFRFAWRLNPGDRVRDGRGKWVLRQLLERHVPAQLVDRPKMGFGVPLGEWLRGPLRSWADDLLEPSALSQQGFFDVAAIDAKWQDHCARRSNRDTELWPVLMFQAWLAEQPHRSG